MARTYYGPSSKFYGHKHNCGNCANCRAGQVGQLIGSIAPRICANCAITTLTRLRRTSLQSLHAHTRNTLHRRTPEVGARILRCRLLGGDCILWLAGRSASPQHRHSAYGLPRTDDQPACSHDVQWRLRGTKGPIPRLAAKAHPGECGFLSSSASAVFVRFEQRKAVDGFRMKAWRHHVKTS